MINPPYFIQGRIGGKITPYVRCVWQRLTCLIILSSNLIALTFDNLAWPPPIDTLRLVIDSARAKTRSGIEFRVLSFSFTNPYGVLPPSQSHFMYSQNPHLANTMILFCSAQFPQRLRPNGKDAHSCDIARRYDDEKSTTPAWTIFLSAIL